MKTGRSIKQLWWDISSPTHQNYEGVLAKGQIIIRIATGNPLIWREIGASEKALKQLIRETAKRRVRGVFNYLRKNDALILSGHKNLDRKEVVKIMEAENLTYADIDTNEAEFVQVVGHKLHQKTRN